MRILKLSLKQHQVKLLNIFLNTGQIIKVLESNFPLTMEVLADKNIYTFEFLTTNIMLAYPCQIEAKDLTGFSHLSYGLAEFKKTKIANIFYY